MASDPGLWAGACMGFAGALALVIAFTAAADNRWVTRREYNVLGKSIQRQLNEIKRGLHLSVNEEDEDA